MNRTIELKVSEEQWQELESRAMEQGLGKSPAKLVAVVVRDELSSQESLRKRVSDDLREKGWDRQADRVESGALDPSEQLDLIHD